MGTRSRRPQWNLGSFIATTSAPKHHLSSQPVQHRTRCSSGVEHAIITPTHLACNCTMPADIRSFFGPKGGAAPAPKPAAKPAPKKTEEASSKRRGSMSVDQRRLNSKLTSLQKTGKSWAMIATTTRSLLSSEPPRSPASSYWS